VARVRHNALHGKVILVTGAASGIGAGTALELARRGAKLVLVDCDTAGVRAAAAATAAVSPEAAGKNAANTVLALTADITSLPACQAAAAEALATHGRIDMVWANAGMASFGPLTDTDPAAWQHCINVNVIGTFNTVRACLPAVLAARGQVAISASVASFAHAPFMSAYAASKSAIEAMGNSWRIELAGAGVSVSVIHPTWVTTPLVSEAALHPSFVRLRATMPGALGREMPLAQAAVLIADGLAARKRQVWVPGWVQWLYWLRPLLTSPLAERELLRAVPEMQAHYLEGLAAAGSLASSLGPREHARAVSANQQPVGPDQKQGAEGV